eukprot:364166-Chlamydomonas_euryale.AAC.1
MGNNPIATRPAHTAQAAHPHKGITQGVPTKEKGPTRETCTGVSRQGSAKEAHTKQHSQSRHMPPRWQQGVAHAMPSLLASIQLPAASPCTHDQPATPGKAMQPHLARPGSHTRQGQAATPGKARQPHPARPSSHTRQGHAATPGKAIQPHPARPCRHRPPPGHAATPGKAMQTQAAARPCRNTRQGHAATQPATTCSATRPPTPRYATQQPTPSSEQRTCVSAASAPGSR